jgi:hypothetical protein
MQRADALTNGRDELFVVGEVPDVSTRLDQNEQQAIVRRSEVSGSGILRLRGENPLPGRGDGCARLEAVRDHFEQRVQEGSSRPRSMNPIAKPR